MNHLCDQFLLRPDVIFLNHGSFGACPKPIFDNYQAWQLELEREPVEFLGRRFYALMQSARESLAAYVGAQPDEIVYVPNATTGLNTVARSLHLQPGDEILTTNHEYGALDRTWRFMCRQTGAKYINWQLPDPLESHEQFIEALWRGVTDRTRVIFLSHITSPTALLFPVKEICQRARESGIISVVDGAHAPGQVPLDLDQIDPDFYSGNCHKWMCSAKGSAFLYARREMQRLLEPLIVSWGWESDQPSGSPFIDQNEWQGTRDLAAYLSVPAAIEFMAEHHWDQVRSKCSALAAEAGRRITALTEQPPLHLDSFPNDIQMVSVPLPPCDPVNLQGRLFEDYRIEVPLVTWEQRPLIRVSIQAYNTQADVDRLIEALTELLPVMNT